VGVFSHKFSTAPSGETTDRIKKVRRDANMGWTSSITMRTLSYREHFTKTEGKLKNRNNLLMKLASSTWGANTLLWHFAIQQQSTAPQSGHALLTQVRSGRCAAELYHAPHLWYPPLYNSPMASSALQHWTASPTKECCHWQAGEENCQTW